MLNYNYYAKIYGTQFTATNVNSCQSMPVPATEILHCEFYNKQWA